VTPVSYLISTSPSVSRSVGSLLFSIALFYLVSPSVAKWPGVARELQPLFLFLFIVLFPQSALCFFSLPRVPLLFLFGLLGFGCPFYGIVPHDDLDTDDIQS